MDDVYELLNYLPINKNQAESDYISHLISVCQILEQSLHLWRKNEMTGFAELDDSLRTAYPFILMPFHLLFMLSLQYKIMRIAKSTHYQKSCETIFAINGGYDKEKLLDQKRSVFDIALLNESSIGEIFRLVNIDKEIIKRIKKLVRYRNDSLAHAKGQQEKEPELIIKEYLDILEEIQNCMLELNEKVAERWLSEMESGEDGAEYIELHLAEEYLCPADMQQGRLAELDKRLNKEI